MLIVDKPIGADLVDMAVLYERLKQWKDAVYDTVTLAFLHELKMLIGSAPHIKAVEHVRCGECRWWSKDEPDDEYGYCYNGKIIGSTKENWYCADGERKDGAV